MSGILILIKDIPTAGGVFDTPTTQEVQVEASVKSVGYREVYEAMGHGLNPEKVFVLPYAYMYHDEKRCRFCGVEYDIIRTYETESNGIELTVQRRQVTGSAT